MSFFAILFALLLEQARPLARSTTIHALVRHWSSWVGRNIDAGRTYHAWLAWGVAVLLPSSVAFAVHLLLESLVGWPASMVWSVAVLYITLGFRQFSHHFTRIRDALLEGDTSRACEVLAHWQQVDGADLPRGEVVRHVIEYSVLAAHRHMFGVLAWFSVLAACGLGPAGAVFYRLAEFVSRYWRRESRTSRPAGSSPESAALQTVAARVWTAVDWLPARMTALSFAVVGSFEDAIDGWRYHVQRFPNDNDGVVLAATAGAVGIRLGGHAAAPLSVPGPSVGLSPPVSPEVPMPGREPSVSHLAEIVGLVWRSVVVWMGLLALLTLARLLG
jgi:adenosylcobinamide-phosphate synthase